jgi:hypothetical protein
VLRNYKGVIVGRSAGALALSRRSVITGKNGVLKFLAALV